MRVTPILSHLFFPALLWGQATQLPEVVVTASRLQTPLAEVPLQADVLHLEQEPAVPLDTTLRTLPAFALFRRNSSSVLQPTSQGVSLRGIGPSGASRSAVYFDGVPVTDAFGGWVAWPKVSPLELAAIEVLPGGGAGSWGNAALSGTIHLIGHDFSEGWRARASWGSRASPEAEMAGTLTAAGKLSLSAGAARKRSRAPIAPELAGPVDRDAGLEYQRFAAGWRHTLPGGAVFTTRIRMYQDDRDNGTALQYNAYRERQVSMSLRDESTADRSWDLLAYIQRQHFRSTFTAVNATRTLETPSSDQYAVPATSWGLAGHAFWVLPWGRLSSGADVRAVSGETNETYSFDGRAFTRLRRAGGRQAFAGAFVQANAKPAQQLTLSGGARLDTWSDSGGFRRDTSRDGATVYRDEHYNARHGAVFTPELGAVLHLSPSSRLFASGQTGFRRPTLNELYRPFRVGNDLTEPNPRLGTERIRSLEAGAEGKAGPVRLRASLFDHDVRDVVASYTRYRGPGVYPEFGFIPAGGTGRVRVNLDRAVTQGFETRAEITLPARAALTLAWQHATATVGRASSAPDLVGKRLPQTPRDVATAQLRFQPHQQVSLSFSGRWSSMQYEDDDNRLRLAAAATLDAAAEIRFTPHWSLFATLQNAFDSPVEASRSASGSYTLGFPREWRLGLEWSK
ncbi:TonB-dependent receptor [Nibricoccus sp. IMCC34717]|uniref:TonB-dependent receptor n=1 Tax=Nibricoccus sp. IMCC34717 TaxID=3034021 RepID=UPI00384E001F